jgi:AraC-like DNA-binding protein
MHGNSTKGFQKTGSTATLPAPGPDGLEGSCRIETDEIRAAPEEGGIERIEARFHGNGFAPHRHDTYALGITVSGVQTFRYRGASRFSMPGQLIILHPDELHDGGAGTESGLSYRMIYIPPDRIANAAGGSGGRLPFVPAPVMDDPNLRASLAYVLDDLDQEIGDMKLDCFLAEVAAGLNRHSDDRRRSASRLDGRAVSDCRDFLTENCRRTITSGELEMIAGIDRFTLARQFRTAYGTSPHRFQVLRRLDVARRLMRKGHGLADAAFDSGFADQAHMTRHFKKTYGMTPGRWLALQSAS